MSLILNLSLVKVCIESGAFTMTQLAEKGGCCKNTAHAFIKMAHKLGALELIGRDEASDAHVQPYLWVWKWQPQSHRPKSTSAGLQTETTLSA